MPGNGSGATQAVWDQRLGFWWIAEDHPDHLAVVDAPEGVWTYGRLAGAVHQLVHGLRSIGTPVGSIVGVLAPNGVVPIRVSLACQEAGWNLLLVNACLTAEEIETMLEHAGARAVVVHEQHADRLDGEVGERIKALTTIIGAGSVPGVTNLDELCADQPTSPPADRTEGGMIAYSSGTTGKPKGISRSGSGADPSVAANRAAVFGRAFDFRPFDGPHLVSTAMYHGGSHSYYVGALHVGHGLVIMPRFNAEAALAAIERHRVRSAYMVPTQFNRFLALPEEVRARYDMSSLHSVVHSAAPCPRPVKEAMMAWWGPVIYETYGGMEGAATIAKPHRWLERPGTVGRAVKGVRLGIYDDEGNELGPGETGNIFYETEADFAYHRDPDLTDQAHIGRKFTIGDVGYIDPDGYLFIQDRAKDMIISGGVNIFPAEIESVLVTHPDVEDVAVIGVPDADWGEQVLAIVQPAAGVEASETLAETLLAYCAEHLAAYKRPRRVEFRDELPRTEAGKLYKRKLRDEFWSGTGRQL